MVIMIMMIVIMIFIIILYDNISIDSCIKDSNNNNNNDNNYDNNNPQDRESRVKRFVGLPLPRSVAIFPIRIARIHVTRFSPRVGLTRQIYLIGNLSAALRFSKAWVRKDANLGLRTGCIPPFSQFWETYNYFPPEPTKAAMNSPQYVSEGLNMVKESRESPPSKVKDRWSRLPRVSDARFVNWPQIGGYVGHLGASLFATGHYEGCLDG